MMLLLILGSFAVWGYAIWVFKRKGDLPWEDYSPPEHRNGSPDAFQPKRRLLTRRDKKRR